nr:MAG TPA: hypothetical protein [Caudoviricetes sp.]
MLDTLHRSAHDIRRRSCQRRTLEGVQRVQQSVQFRTLYLYSFISVFFCVKPLTTQI